MKAKLRWACILTANFAAIIPRATPAEKSSVAPPNIIVVLADQGRAQAFGFAGDPNVKTPNFDRLAGESCHLVNAVSRVSVCSPTRASLLTGRPAGEAGEQRMVAQRHEAAVPRAVGDEVIGELLASASQRVRPKLSHGPGVRKPGPECGTV